MRGSMTLIFKSCCYEGMILCYNLWELNIYRCVCMYFTHSPFREQNDTHAVNRTCEWFCACDLHACLSLNGSDITTKYHRNNSTFFKIRYIYTKGRNLTFKIVYSTGLGGSPKNTETKNRHEKTLQNRSSALGSLPAVVISACDMLLTHTALFKDGVLKHKQRIERRIFYEQDLFGWILLFMRATNSMRR